jgi:hypothetical protein
MKKSHQIQTSLVLLEILAMLLSACSTATPSTPTTGKVPDSLVTIEAQAEDIIDFAPSGNWQKISSDVRTISDAWKTYQPEIQNDGATQDMIDSFNTALTHLQTAVSAQDKTGTMQASNDISGVVVDLFDLYHPAIPANVGRLDVLERQIVLDTASSNFTAVQEDLDKINQIWQKLKPSVLEHNGEETAKQFEASLSLQVESLKTQHADALTQEAKNALEIVDALENLY